MGSLAQFFVDDDGERLRDEGIRSVVANAPDEWKKAYRRSVTNWFGDLPSGSTFTGENMRLAALRAGTGDPHHQNAWGGVANGLIRRWMKLGWIEGAGLQAASDPRAHARRYPQYRKV